MDKVIDSRTKIIKAMDLIIENADDCEIADRQGWYYAIANGGDNYIRLAGDDRNFPALVSKFLNIMTEIKHNGSSIGTVEKVEININNCSRCRHYKELPALGYYYCRAIGCVIGVEMKDLGNCKCFE